MSPSFTVSFVILQMLCLENDCRLSLEVVLSVVRVPGKSSTPPKGYPGTATGVTHDNNMGANDEVGLLRQRRNTSPESS